MEIKPGMGPAPVRAGATGRSLSGQRAVVLERLQQRGQPLTVAELAAELGLHPNTVREHLDALVSWGLVVRGRQAKRGRGRPAWTYAAAADLVEPDTRVRDYAGLATALAAHIALTSADPRGDALAAGRDWGRGLAAAHPFERPPSATAVRRRVVALLDELGFAPQDDARCTTAALRRCPLLDVATRYPEVVCQVHLGIVRGAMEAYGSQPERTALIPFAEVGACRLHLLTAA